jgi:L-asparaginase/Glu-tRNA(Gln) amidotransferase subunit D
MSNIDLDKLFPVAAPTEAETAGIRNRLETQQPAFISHEDYLAILAFGGTIQSAYVPAQENIVPVPMNPGFERIAELEQRFGIARKEVTGAILVAKDSREITNADLIQLIHTIEQIPNKRILISCGTYMLPLISRALDVHFRQRKSDKIIGIIGSWLPASQQGQDVDFNIGGGIAAINALNEVNYKGIVFAQFHGEIFAGDDILKLSLHPPGVNPRFAHPIVKTL